MYTVLIVFHVVLAAGLIAIVLVQRGPGATMGAAFGAGASGTVFGSRGAAGFLTRATAWLGVGFFAISLSMAVLAARTGIVTESPDDLGVVGAIDDTPVEVEEVLEIPLELLVDEETSEEAEFLPPPDESP